jgi:hypothetical protein
MKSFIHGIKNLIKWFPIIWKDHDFDEGYLLIIMRFKLKNMEEFFNSNQAFTVSAKRHVHEIMIVKNLIDRIHKNNYSSRQWPRTYEEYMINQDLEYLGLMLKKHLRDWCD